ncbi:MAG: Endonuclease III [Clostridiales bacterium 38_11]|nr:MAG: Endonuclease III [Clostridiales bacterium 38_11]HBH13153.1 endonuclease III [Clostridiales bacterium]
MIEINLIFEKLNECYPDARCELDYKSPFQLLIATILSAQATDKSVNKLTTNLFQDYPDLEAFLELSEMDINEKIREIGLYKSKSKNIYRLCRILKDGYNSKVPETIEELMTLPGVGKKTASVVLSEAFGIPVLAVDTHVFRVTRRIGLTKKDTPDKVADDLMSKINKNNWIIAHHLFIFHGRRTCKARKPDCGNCIINKECKKIGI